MVRSLAVLEEHRFPGYWAPCHFEETVLRQIDVLRAERDQARARVDTAVRLLTGVHSLLYPAPITTADGRTMVFRPTDPDPHEVLQALSDRIRALPDELERLRAVALDGSVFPAHRAELHLDHNDHKNAYESAEHWIVENGETYAWQDDEAKQRAIDTDEIWTLQWYPNTPIGFFAVAAPTLDEVLALAKAVEKGDLL